MERNTRKTLIGVVTSTKNSKTIAVLVSTHKKHPWVPTKTRQGAQ